MKLHKIIFLSLFVVLTACGNSKDSEKNEEESFQINKLNEAEKEEVDGVTEVLLTSNDQMRFNKSEIRVKAGDKVKLTLKHVGKLGVEVMGHNFVLLKPDVERNEFAKKAVDAKDNGYIPEGTEDVIVHTKMIGGGQQTSIEFDAPEKGTYEFICSFPGHVALMNGKFIVE
jgi:azurin